MSHENGWTRVFPQVDFCTCIRCGRVEVPTFTFDDGSFYCYRCMCFMEGGAIYSGVLPARLEIVGAIQKHLGIKTILEGGGKTEVIYEDGRREEVI